MTGGVLQESMQISVQATTEAVIAFIGYILIIILVGVFTVRFSSQGIGEFFLGGRRVNRFVVALSAVVSGRSAWLLLGVTGLAYVQGLSAIWAVVGYIAVELFLFLYLAPVLRERTEAMNSLTLPDFFQAHFQDKSGMLRLVSVFIIFIFMIAYVAAQFKGGGKAFSASFGLTEPQGLLLTAAIVLLYTILGGFLAVSITDMIQAIFMMVALVVLPITVVIHYGGLDPMLQQLNVQNPQFMDPFALTLGSFFGFIGIGLGSPGNPHILVRYMSIRDAKQLKVSAIVGTIWNVLMGLGAICIGLVGRVCFPLLSALPNADRENLYPVLAAEHLHPLLFGCVTASIFAAIMSTADSQLLVASSSIVRDIYQKTIKKTEPLSENHLVLLSRFVVFILVGFAIVLGFVAAEWIFWLVLFAWGGLGASLGPAVIFTLFWKKTTKQSVLAGLISGTLVVIIWKSIPALQNMLYELIPAFFVATAMIVLVSSITGKN